MTDHLMEDLTYNRIKGRDMSNHLDMTEMDHKQMLERERAVVQGLHDRGLCIEDCIICREKSLERTVPKLTPMFTDADHEYAHEKGICLDDCPHCSRNKLLSTLSERGAEYGDYTKMARLAQNIKHNIRHGGSWARLSDDQRESLDLIATKIARIVCGNPDNPDSWLDIEGYAKLARDRIAPAPATGRAATP